MPTEPVPGPAGVGGRCREMRGDGQGGQMPTLRIIITRYHTPAWERVEPAAGGFAASRASLTTPCESPFPRRRADIVSTILRGTRDDGWRATARRRDQSPRERFAGSSSNPCSVTPARRTGSRRNPAAVEFHRRPPWTLLRVKTVSLASPAVTTMTRKGGSTGKNGVMRSLRRCRNKTTITRGNG